MNGSMEGEEMENIGAIKKCGILLSEIYGVGSCAEDLIYMGSLATILVMNNLYIYIYIEAA